MHSSRKTRCLHKKVSVRLDDGQELAILGDTDRCGEDKGRSESVRPIIIIDQGIDSDYCQEEHQCDREGHNRAYAISPTGANIKSVTVIRAERIDYGNLDGIIPETSP